MNIPDPAFSADYVPDNSPGGRLIWVDRLKLVVVSLVVLFHVGGVYESAGLWASFWIVDDPSTFLPTGIINIVLDTSLMPAMFFAAGIVAPMSRRNRTAGQFIGRKARQLLVPWVIGVLVLMPVYRVIFLYSRGWPQDAWYSYFHFMPGNPFSQNWLWFLPVLFVFHVLYVGISGLGFDAEQWPAGKTILLGVLASLIYSIGVGWIVDFRSWTLTPLLDFENERLIPHFIAYLIGIAVSQRYRSPSGQRPGRGFQIASWMLWLPLTLHIWTRLVPFLFPQLYSTGILYRSVWWVGFHLSSLCSVVVLSEGLSQMASKRRIRERRIDGLSFGIYFLHVPALGILGTALLGLDWPGALKYPVLSIGTLLVSGALAAGYRRIRFQRSGNAEAEE